jgi:hypothetical protein
MDELSYNTPIFKDAKYTECEYCCGDGWIFDPLTNGQEKSEHIDCPKCNGEGQIEITD